MKNSLTIDHINLTVKNFAESAIWYQKALDFEKVEEGFYQGAPWGRLQNKMAHLCLYEDAQALPPHENKPSRHLQIYHFGLRADNVQDWKDRLARLGLPTYFDSPVRYPKSTSWYLKDPSGHTVEISCWDQDSDR